MNGDHAAEAQGDAGQVGTLDIENGAGSTRTSTRGWTGGQFGSDVKGQHGTRRCSAQAVSRVPNRRAPWPYKHQIYEQLRNEKIGGERWRNGEMDKRRLVD